MNSDHINPFLESSIMVIEQVCRIRPSLGRLQLRSYAEDQVLLQMKIDVVGDMEGEIVYSFPKEVALKLVSEMMGGFTVTELDEIGHSAIAELGNMISGNASSILSRQGVAIDITPPRPVENKASVADKRKTLNIPLRFEGLGELNIFVHLQQKKAV